MKLTFNNFCTLLIFLTLFKISNAQQIEGKVIDVNTREPIENVNVFLKGQNQGAITDNNGNFDLNTEKDVTNDDLITFTHISYRTQNVSFRSLKEKGFVVELIADTTKLDEIDLLSESKLNSQLKFRSLANMITGVYNTKAVLRKGKIYVFGGDASEMTASVKKAMEDNPGIASDDKIGIHEMLKRTAQLSLGSVAKFSDEVQVFDIARNKWGLENIRLKKKANHEVLYDETDDKAYILGGKSMSKNKRFVYLNDEIEVLNFKNDSIMTDNANPHQAVNFASFIFGDKIIVMGGSVKQNKNGGKEYSNKVHLFETGTGLWYELGNMPQAKETSGILAGTVFYLIGGYNQNPLPYIETYNLTTGKWNRIGEFFDPVAEPALTENEGVVYIYYPGNLCTFDLGSGYISEYSIDFYVKAPRMLYYDNKLYLLGGYNEEANTVKPSFRVIDINLGNLKDTLIKRSKKIGDTI